MGEKKVVYILGPQNAPNYWEAFEKAEDELTAEGFIPLSPSRLPHDLSKEKARQLYTAMLSVADAVLILPGLSKSFIGQIELSICKYLHKPHALSVEMLKGVLEV